MAKKFFFIAVVAAALLSFTAHQGWASVPDPGNSQAGWWTTPRPPTPPTSWDGLVLLCPGADGSYIWAEVKDQFNAPMAGVGVDINVAIDCPDLVWCPPGTAPDWMPDTTIFTDMNGRVTLTFPGAGRHCAGDDTLCCAVTTTIACLGVTLYSATDDLSSPDMTQTVPSGLYVEGLDYGIFASDWLRSGDNRCRSDYKKDVSGKVEGLDYAIFASHWLHVCP